MPTALFQQEPGSLNLEGVVGDDLTVPLQVEDVNLTGYTFFAGIATSQNPAYYFTTFNIVETDLAQGLVTLALSDAQTAAIGAVSEYPWNFGWTDGSGNKRTILAGKFTLNRNTLSGDVS